MRLTVCSTMSSSVPHTNTISCAYEAGEWARGSLSADDVPVSAAAAERVPPAASRIGFHAGSAGAHDEAVLVRARPARLRSTCLSLPLRLSQVSTRSTARSTP